MNLPRWQVPTLALFAAASLFLFLGTRGLNEPDEGRYAEIGREMVASGDWLVPHLNGIPHFQKPPLLYWATAASIRVFGVNEWGARVPSALAAFGVIALTYWIGLMLFDRSTGVAAALVLLSSLEFFGCARLLTPDMFMAFWITAAIACLIRFGKGGHRLWAWLFFAAMGLGFLTKGPMAFVVPISAALSWQISRRRGPDPLRLPWLGGVALMLAIGLSWFIVLSVQNPALLHYFAGDELIQRFASKHHGRSKPFWFFAWVLPAGLYPWTFFLGAMLWHLGRGAYRGWRPQPDQWLLIGWVAIPLMILSLSGSKLPTYVLPLFPSMALAIGHWTRTRENFRLWNAALVTTLIALAAVCVAVEAVEHTAKIDLPDSFLIIPSLVGCLVLMRHHPVTARMIVCMSTAFLWLATVEEMQSMNKHLEQQASVKPLAERLLAAPDLSRATIFACEVRAHGWEFYLQRLTHVTQEDADIVLPLTPAQAARMIPTAKQCEEVMLRQTPAYGLVRKARFHRSFEPEKWKVLGQAGDFLLIASNDAALANL
jgi:4-amino-4-deoxy-L-arabinose transferase-like glycosyltransferase